MQKGAGNTGRLHLLTYFRRSFESFYSLLFSWTVTDLGESLLFQFLKYRFSNRSFRHCNPEIVCDGSSDYGEGIF